MLRFTQEADDALRIVWLLAQSGEVQDAGTLAQTAGIAPRFALKILRKLREGGIVASKKGSTGGYVLARPTGEITVLQVLELIEGPLYINRCLEEGYVCSRMGVQTGRCVVHRLFSDLSRQLSAQLSAITLEELARRDAAYIRGQCSE